MLPLQAGWKKVEPCLWRGHKVDDVQDDIHAFWSREAYRGKHLPWVWSGLCGALWWLWGTGCTHSSFNSKYPETGLGWNLRRWCFYSSCQGCVYTLSCGLSVWGYSRAQGLWGLCQMSWVFGTINIYALAWGWILVCCVLSVVSSLLFWREILVSLQKEPVSKHSNQRDQSLERKQEGIQANSVNLLPK